MIIASYVFFGLFALCSFIHLIFCFLEKEKARKISKIFCVTLLAIAAILYKPNAPLIYVGAFLGVIGDIFLIFKKNIKSFFVGTIFFIGGHVLYLTQAILLINPNSALHWSVYLVVGLILLLLTFGLYPITGKKLGPTALIGNFYMPFLLVLLSLGIYLSVVNNNYLPGLLFACGYLSFFISDSTLIYTSFFKDIKRRDFYIMLFYLIAQALIITGLLLA